MENVMQVYKPSGSVLSACHWTLLRSPPKQQLFCQRSKKLEPVQTLDAPRSLATLIHCVSAHNSIHLLTPSILWISCCVHTQKHKHKVINKKEKEIMVVYLPAGCAVPLSVLTFVPDLSGIKSQPWILLACLCTIITGFALTFICTSFIMSSHNKHYIDSSVGKLQCLTTLLCNRAYLWPA